MSRAKAARELERQIMTMEVVSGEETPEFAEQNAASQPIELPDRLAFGPYGITPLRGLHFDNAHDTAAS
jgi:hypothetical protein